MMQSSSTYPSSTPAVSMGEDTPLQKIAMMTRMTDDFGVPPAVCL